MATTDAQPGAYFGRGGSYEPRPRDPAADIVGQEFYEDDDFPNTDFSRVEILGERGQTIDVLIVKRGRKLRPERVVTAAVKNRLELPEHLTIVPGSLERIEASLSSRSVP